jgi:PAS domain S-box-containing protein
MIALLSSSGMRTVQGALLVFSLALAAVLHLQTAAGERDGARIALLCEQQLLAERIPRQLLQLQKHLDTGDTDVGFFLDFQRSVGQLEAGMRRMRQSGFGAQAAEAAMPTGRPEGSFHEAEEIWRQLQPALLYLSERPDLARSGLLAIQQVTQSAMPALSDRFARLHSELRQEHATKMHWLRDQSYLLLAITTLLLALSTLLRRRQLHDTLPSLSPTDPTAVAPAMAIESDLVWSKNEVGAYTSCNAACAGHLGRSPQDIIGKTDFELTDPRSARSDRASDLQTQTTGQAVSLQEWRTSALDGRRHLLEIVKTPLWNPHGAFAGVQVVARDITRRTEAEDALRQAHARLQLLEMSLSHVSDAIVITEAEPTQHPGPRIVFVNRAFETMTGYSAAEAIGRTPRFLQGEGTASDELDRLRTALSGWRRARVELLNYAKDGRAFWVEIDVSPVADEKGWFTHWVAVQRDITARKRAMALGDGRTPGQGPGQPDRKPVPAPHAPMDKDDRVETDHQALAACGVQILLQDCADQALALVAPAPPRLHTGFTVTTPAIGSGDARRVQLALMGLVQWVLNHCGTSDLWLSALRAAAQVLRIEILTESCKLDPRALQGLASALADQHPDRAAPRLRIQTELLAAREIALRMGGRLGLASPSPGSHLFWLELPVQFEDEPRLVAPMENALQ